MTRLKIEMVHDAVCSWCPIGYANLKRALRALDVKADVYFLPHELNPDMAPEGESINQHLARRYQWGQKKLKDYRQNLLTVSEQAGVIIDFTQRTHYYNTHQTHRLIHWCETYNKQQEMNELLTEAYYQHGRNINDTSILLELVERAGLERSIAEEMLLSNAVDQRFLLKKQRVQQLALASVPAFIFNEQHVVVGSHSPVYFEQLITHLAENRTS